MRMSIKKVIINLIISILVGIILGSVSEFALILNIDWLIEITQSAFFWIIVICISAFLSREYIFEIANPAIIMTFMSMSYYLIRLIKSGYTDTWALKVYSLAGIAISVYMGTIIYLIKEKLLYHKSKVSKKYTIIFMTIFGILSAFIGFLYSINHNLLFNIDVGIFIGFIIGINIDNKKMKR